MNDSTVARIPLDSIEIDPIFSGTFSSSPAAMENFKFLMESIREQGLMTPLVVVKSGSMYKLISGLRRFHALRELKEHWVNVLVLKFKTNDEILRYVMNTSHSAERKN